MILNVTNAIPASGIPTSGTNVYQGTMAPVTTLDVHLPLPVYATNAVLVITSGYDRGVSTNPRTVQVVEMTFFERAMPGTYGEWAIAVFGDSLLADPAIGGSNADPDGDGVPNLVEFAVGGNPFVSDGSLAALQPMPAAPGTFVFRFRERKNLGDVQRSFEYSSDMVNWTQVTPASLTNVADLGDVWLREVTFATPDGIAFFRLKFTQTSP
jgi:hypothetical protein